MEGAGRMKEEGGLAGLSAGSVLRGCTRTGHCGQLTAPSQATTPRLTSLPARRAATHESNPAQPTTADSQRR